MFKLLIILGLVPVIFAVAVRKIFGDRVLKRLDGRRVSLTPKEAAEQILAGAGLKHEVDEGRRSKLTTDKLILEKESRGTRVISEVAGACLLAGRAILSRRQPELLKWREWAAKFSWAFPAFSIVVIIFALVVSKVPATLALALAILSVGIGTAVSMVVAWVDWQAAGLVDKLTEARAVIAREEERQEVVRAMKALSAQKAVPGMLEMFFPKGAKSPGDEKKLPD